MYLGDAYLKYLSSTYLYATMPGQREGALNHARAQIVSNKALRAGALQFGLPPYIQTKPMNTKNWQLCLQVSKPDVDEDASMTVETEGRGEGKGRRKGKRKRQQDEQFMQWLGDKVCTSLWPIFLKIPLMLSLR
jgi:endoribonuclease Dicer